MPLKRAQNERLRGPPPGCGALRLEPVARLYFFLPAAVSPPLRLLCLPILRETFFFLLTAMGHEIDAALPRKSSLVYSVSDRVKSMTRQLSSIIQSFRANFYSGSMFVVRNGFPPLWVKK